MTNDKFNFLAFRGTEAMCMGDIKTDLKAEMTQCETGGKIHLGFKEASDQVIQDIHQKLNEDNFKKKPLFITGHSLGGALATIATKKLIHKGGIAACYTFGSPRVGNDEWAEDIKAPVYRLVNAADLVTMLPPGDTLMTVVCLGLRFLVALRIPFVSQWIMPLHKYLFSKVKGYLHYGDMRYLKNCSDGQYDDVKLLTSVSWFYRIKAFCLRKYPFTKFINDHKISIYVKKLMIIAEKRN